MIVGKSRSLNYTQISATQKLMRIHIKCENNIWFLAGWFQGISTYNTKTANWQRIKTLRLAPP